MNDEFPVNPIFGMIPGTNPATDLPAVYRYGSYKNDVLTGTEGKDALIGREGNDTLSGLDDNDILIRLLRKPVSFLQYSFQALMTTLTPSLEILILRL